MLAAFEIPLPATLLLGPYPQSGHAEASPISLPHLEHIAISTAPGNPTQIRRRGVIKMLLL
jgi:hypothetical protein